MNTADLVKKLCDEKEVSLAELARRIGQSRQNFYKKLRRDTLTIGELRSIADSLGVTFDQSFILPNGEKVSME
jgi:transcriptional regulator with XRE-family HTH domain